MDIDSFLNLTPPQKLEATAAEMRRRNIELRQDRPPAYDLMLLLLVEEIEAKCPGSLERRLAEYRDAPLSGNVAA